MAVDSKHKDHRKWVQDWQLIKTLKEGQRSLVNEGEKFLPKLSGQSPAEYDAYIKRGSLFNATAKTLGGLVGAIVRKKPTLKTPNSFDLENVTISGQSVYEVIKDIADEIMSYGFYGILVDMPENAPAGTVPYMAMYDASDILNWFTQKVGNEEKLVMVSLAETILEQDPEDPYSFNSISIIRVCFIDANDGNKYKQQKWRKMEKKGSKDEWVKEGEEIIPTKQGIPLNEIPFVFFSAMGCCPVPSKPPLLDLANLNIKHWQVSTDYYHGLHYCAIPTPWAAGFDIGSQLYIGSQKAWISEDPQAKCGYLEFTGQGIAAIEKSLDKLERQMAVAGARLLEEQKAGVEAAEAIRLRTSGDDATMGSIVTTIEDGIKKVFGYMADWSGAGESIDVTMNRDFVSQKLTAQEITALLQTVQAGKMSTDSFIYNLQMGEYLPPDRNIEDEMKLIESEKPTDFNSSVDRFGNNDFRGNQGNQGYNNTGGNQNPGGNQNDRST